MLAPVFVPIGKVVGVDISPDMLAVARAVAPSVDWRQGNATDLPLQDGEQFDVVLSTGIAVLWREVW
jgi:ubiquinone/menaquinone biosynthesis C-methylase UbiE